MPETNRASAGGALRWDPTCRFRDRAPRPDEGKQPRNELRANVKDGVGRIYLYDVIDREGGYWGISSAEFAEALDELGDVDTIHLHVNSPGGMVFEGITIKNLLAQHPAHVVAIVDGLAASAASFIAAAADEVVMGENAEMMIHDARTFMVLVVNAEELREAADVVAADLDRVSDNIASIYAARTDRTADEWRADMKAETWYTAEAAVEAGLADRVGTPDEGDTSNTLDPRRQFAAALNVIRAASTPAETADPAQIAALASTTEEETGQQAETAPPATAESGAASRSTEPSNSPSAQKETAMPSMTIEEREARITEIDARRTDINAAHTGDVLPEAAQAEWDEITNEREEHLQAIAAQRARTEQLAAAAHNEAAAENAQTTAPRATALSRATPAAIIKPDNIYDTTAIRDRSRSRAEMAKGLRDNAMRAVDAATFPGTDREKAQERVSKLVDKFAGENDTTLAERILNTGSDLYDRAFGKAVKAMSTGGLDPMELRALTLGADSEGGYAVPFQLDPTVILTSDGSENPLRQISRVVQITGKKWEGLTSAGITVTRKGETDEATDDSPSFLQPVVDTSRADGFVPFSIALDISWSELRDELTLMLSEAKADEEATSFVTGAGTALTTGGVLPQGILTALSATSTVYVLTGSTGALGLADLRKMKSSLPERFRGNTGWLAADTFYDQADSLITQTTREDIAQSSGDVLLSKPKHQASAMPDYATTASTNLAIYGNFQRGFIIVDRIGMNVELVPTLFGASGRPTGQRGIFAYWFNGSKALVPSAFRLLRMK